MNSKDSGVSSMGPRQDPMRIPSIISPNVGDGGHNVGTTSSSKLHNVEYSLKIRQQPMAARSCGFGERDRRVIDPPPVVQLMIKGSNLAHSQYEKLLRGNHYIMSCSLYDESGSEVATFTTKQRRQERQLLGTVISTPFVGKDEHGEEGCFFCFPDLSCRTPGSFNTGKVDVNGRDSSGWTPLLYAAENGHGGVIKLLLDTGKVDVDGRDDEGRTPLSHAAENGHEAVVKLLLDTGKVDVDGRDDEGRSPLSHAAENGHEAVVKLLLDTGKVGVNGRDLKGWTPIQWAAFEGHRSVIDLLENIMES